MPHSALSFILPLADASVHVRMAIWDLGLIQFVFTHSDFICVSVCFMMPLIFLKAKLIAYKFKMNN